MLTSECNFHCFLSRACAAPSAPCAADNPKANDGCFQRPTGCRQWTMWTRALRWRFFCGLVCHFVWPAKIRWIWLFNFFKFGVNQPFSGGSNKHWWPQQQECWNMRRCPHKVAPNMMVFSLRIDFGENSEGCVLRTADDRDDGISQIWGSEITRFLLSPPVFLFESELVLVKSCKIQMCAQ